MQSLKKLPARFFATSNGHEPVREWLRQLPAEDRKAVGLDIATVEFAWPVGMPLSKPLGFGLFEIRTTLPGKRIARVIFTVMEEELLLLHGFIKKTRQTPKQDLTLARARHRQTRRRH